MSAISPPASRPCGSCPYRQDVPSGVWSEEEYAKLSTYDRDTGDQPMVIFMCHRRDSRICAGWAGTHDMQENLAVRIASSAGRIGLELVESLIDYATDMPLWPSGAAAAEHGRRDIRRPGLRAMRMINQLKRGLP